MKFIFLYIRERYNSIRLCF